jgi:2-(1,2-epoxy-1,2-dihydrophenyl)acetyl-CoA isomerase
VTAAETPPANGTPVLLTERHGPLLVLILNRPDRLNALSPELHAALLAAVSEAADDGAVRALAITGAGRAFCSGGDLGGGARERQTDEQRLERMLHHGRTTRLLHEMSKPTIALLNGAVAGAGLALALACDLRIAADDMVLTTAYAKIGLTGDHGVSWFLSALVGPSRAAELMFLSDKIDAAQALSLGLVNRVVPAAGLREDGLAVARRLSEGPPIALGQIKRNLRAAPLESLAQNQEREALAMIRCGRSDEVKEAMTARRERRAPVFTGS